ncbi:siderophore ferric iron reductase [Vibrio sp. TBV020]|uniref:siderophore ferric iron reductase n=1 Tax=Vibrio sp. TBV020 TaxID=3137398 RepID=UPI0038CDC6B3
MSDSSFFEHLFEHSKQVTPYLSGSIAQLPSDSGEHAIIHIDRSSSDHIHTLYEQLKSQHPEAGSAYWLTRTWTLLCWQPIYVAFIAIYACRGLPNLASMAQSIKLGFVSGYQFESQAFVEGSEQELIDQAGKQLNTLFDYFREEMSQWTRIRPGFTKHLFADGILGSLVKLNQYAPNLPKEYLLDQARSWLQACDLPEKFIKTLTYDETTKQLTLIRTSCCLVYKCDGRKLCSDCPRHPDNKD